MTWIKWAPITNFSSSLVKSLQSQTTYREFQLFYTRKKYERREHNIICKVIQIYRNLVQVDFRSHKRDIHPEFLHFKVRWVIIFEELSMIVAKLSRVESIYENIFETELMLPEFH